MNFMTTSLTFVLAFASISSQTLNYCFLKSASGSSLGTYYFAISYSEYLTVEKLSQNALQISTQKFNYVYNPERTRDFRPAIGMAENEIIKVDVPKVESVELFVLTSGGILGKETRVGSDNCRMQAATDLFTTRQAILWKQEYRKSDGNGVISFVFAAPQITSWAIFVKSATQSKLEYTGYTNDGGWGLVANMLTGKNQYANRKELLFQTSTGPYKITNSCPERYGTKMDYLEVSKEESMVMVCRTSKLYSAPPRSDTVALAPIARLAV